MCGCNSSRNFKASKQKTVSTPRIVIKPKQVSNNNINPAGMVQLDPPGNLNKTDRQRIVQLRKDAIQRSLGKLF